jgi:signal transduction histidine kinase
LNLAGIQLNISVSSLEIYADPMFGKVCYTLIENALRHGEKVTKIDFSFRQSRDDLIIVYQDNGVGIATEDKPKLF